MFFNAFFSLNQRIFKALKHLTNTKKIVVDTEDIVLYNKKAHNILCISTGV